MQARVDKRYLRNKTGQFLTDIIQEPHNARKFKPKSPDKGGGIRTQKYVDSILEDIRAEKHN